MKATFLLLLFYGHVGILALPYPSIGTCMHDAPQKIGTEMENWKGEGEPPKVLFAVCVFGVGQEESEQP